MIMLRHLVKALYQTQKNFPLFLQLNFGKMQHKENITILDVRLQTNLIMQIKIVGVIL